MSSLRNVTLTSSSPDNKAYESTRCFPSHINFDDNHRFSCSLAKPNITFHGTNEELPIFESLVAATDGKQTVDSQSTNTPGGLEGGYRPLTGIQDARHVSPHFTSPDANLTPQIIMGHPRVASNQTSGFAALNDASHTRFNTQTPYFNSHQQRQQQVLLPAHHPLLSSERPVPSQFMQQIFYPQSQDPRLTMPQIIFPPAQYGSVFPKAEWGPVQSQSVLFSQSPPPTERTGGGERGRRRRRSVSPACPAVSPSVKSASQFSSGRKQGGGGGVCAVCGASSSGTHYGVISCDGCRTFFGKSVRRGLRYACSGGSNCPVDKNQALKCQHCRFKKCVAMGMNSDTTHAEKAEPAAPPNPGPGSTTDCEHTGVTSTTDSPTHLATVRGSSKGPGMPRSSSASSNGAVNLVDQIRTAEASVLDVPPDVTQNKAPLFVTKIYDAFTIPDYHSEDATETVVNFIVWCRKIPFFSRFPEPVQFMLLKTSCVELLLIHFVYRLSLLISSEESLSASTASPLSIRLTFPSSSKSGETAKSLTPENPSSPSTKPMSAESIFFPFDTSVNEVFGSLSFKPEAESDIHSLMGWPESRFLLSLFPEERIDENPVTNCGSNELNAQCLSRRLILRHLFDLAYLIQNLKVSVTEVGCLRLLVLFNTDLLGLKSVCGELLGSIRKDIFTCFENICGQCFSHHSHGRIGQLCLALSTLSLIADRIRSPMSPQFHTYKLLLELIGCFDCAPLSNS